MAHTLNMLVGLKFYSITLLTSNKAAALTLRNTRQQSGQEFVCQMYKLMGRLRRNGNQIKIRWAPASEGNKLLGLVKEQARTVTQEDALLQARVPRMKSTTLNIARSQAVPNNGLPENHRRTNVHVDKQDKLLSISSFEAGSGPHSGPKQKADRPEPRR
ncbi:hypothetical protein PENANT_c141G06323 [Penicillium antarcticum]|uniref:Uncharacterized protein n=1 Tax=Penicillium antarcticum TaxID=416450 RepID=A0A1V6PGS1_9EURO|nr:hypothetical protein PENANT_c141G06323 [Penicillium antarcticum]